MAINYLNNVDFNRNELQNAQLIKSQVENQPNDASVGGTPVEGQLYFNTTSDVLKIYGGGTWSEVGGGVISLALNDGTYIDVNSSGTAANPVFTPDLSAVDGTSVAATRFLSKDNTWDVPTYPSDANTTYDLTGVGSTNGTAGVRLTGSDSTTDDVLIVGGGTTTVTRSANTLTVTSNDEFDGTVTSVAATHAGNAFTASIGNTSTINPSVDITMAGTAAQYITGQGNLATFPSIPTVSNATITLAAGNGLITGGAFTLNQSANETITFDLPTVGTAGTIGSASDSIKIDTITLDAYGRVTGTTTGATGQVNTVITGNSNTLTATGTINKTLTAVTAAVANGGASLATGDQIYDFVTGQIANIPSGLAFEGNWDASTGNPPSASPSNGQFWIVSVAGSTSLSGITDWVVGDWAIYVDNGAGTDAWQKVDNTSTLSGSGAANQLTYWTGTANVAGDAGLTYDATGNNLTVGNNITAGGTITSSGGNSGEWNDSYDNMITGFTDSGSGTITLTLTQQDGGTLSTSFANPQGTMSSWTIKEGNGTESTTVSNGDVLTIAQGTGIESEMTSTVSGGTIQITNTDRGSSQNIFKNVASSSGTAVADNNNDTLTIVGAGGISTAVSGDTLTITSSNTNSANTYATTITDSVSGTTLNHGLGEDVIVQLYDATNKDTVYADVVRNGNYLNISFSSTPANSIRVLVQKIG